MEGLFIKRIKKELQMINEYKGIILKPIDNSMKTFHFTIKGEKNSPYQGGIYHGEIVLPSNYPMGAPTLLFLTENGRFKCYEKICLNATHYHDFTWQSSWTMLQLLRGLSLFMLSEEQGVGYLKSSIHVRQQLAEKSKEFKCSNCGFSYEEFKQEFVEENVFKEDKDIKEENKQNIEKENDLQENKNIREENNQKIELEKEMQKSETQNEQKQELPQYNVLKMKHMITKEMEIIRFLGVLKSFKLYEKNKEELKYQGRDVDMRTKSKNVVDLVIFLVVFGFFFIFITFYINILYKLIVLNNL